jgi:aryl-alcohol dehydrogenase-like predicted oxidoreductase
VNARQLGHSDLYVSPITLGTWLSAGDLLSARQLSDLVAVSLERGLTSIDTADSYGFGAVEEALGHTLKTFPRDRFTVFSKCFFSTDPEHTEPFGLSKAAILRAAEASLRRLQLDYIDLYQCHRPDPKTPIPETTAAMEQLVAEGKIRWWGVSKWPEATMKEAIDCGGTHLVSSQDLYNLFNRQPEREHFGFCERHRLGFLAYSPLARGVLTGKYLAAIPAGSRAAHEKYKSTIYDLTPDKHEKVAALKALADQKNCAPGALALAFYLRQPEVASVLIGATSVSQVESNAAALDISLSDGDVRYIDSVFSKKTPQEGALVHGLSH